MRWKSRYHPDWQERFAYFPEMMDDFTMVWWQPYWERYTRREEWTEKKKAERPNVVGMWQRTVTDMSKLADQKTRLVERG